MEILGYDVKREYTPSEVAYKIGKSGYETCYVVFTAAGGDPANSPDTNRIYLLTVIGEKYLTVGTPAITTGERVNGGGVTSPQLPQLEYNNGGGGATIVANDAMFLKPNSVIRNALVFNGQSGFTLVDGYTTDKGKPVFCYCVNGDWKKLSCEDVGVKTLHFKNSFSVKKRIASWMRTNGLQDIPFSYLNSGGSWDCEICVPDQELLSKIKGLNLEAFYFGVHYASSNTIEETTYVLDLGLFLDDDSYRELAMTINTILSNYDMDVYNGSIVLELEFAIPLEETKKVKIYGEIL